MSKQNKEIEIILSENFVVDHPDDFDSLKYDIQYLMQKITNDEYKTKLSDTRFSVEKNDNKVNCYIFLEINVEKLDITIEEKYKDVNEVAILINLLDVYWDPLTTNVDTTSSEQTYILNNVSLTATNKMHNYKTSTDITNESQSEYTLLLDSLHQFFKEIFKS